MAIPVVEIDPFLGRCVDSGYEERSSWSFVVVGLQEVELQVIRGEIHPGPGRPDRGVRTACRRGLASRLKNLVRTIIESQDRLGERLIKNFLPITAFQGFSLHPARR